MPKKEWTSKGFACVLALHLNSNVFNNLFCTQTEHTESNRFESNPKKCVSPTFIERTTLFPLFLCRSLPLFTFSIFFFYGNKACLLHSDSPENHNLFHSYFKLLYKNSLLYSTARAHKRERKNRKKKHENVACNMWITKECFVLFDSLIARYQHNKYQQQNE